MLYRKNRKKIECFLNSNLYKSMLLVGVRQCGKTTLLKNMLKDSNVIYCNLEEQLDIANIFDGNLTANSIVDEIEMLTNQFFKENETKILVLDEIQVNPRAITSLKYFDESDMDIKVIGSGSLLGVQLKAGDFSFPVGKVDIINMYPLDFEEFLVNNNMQRHVEKIKECFESNMPMTDSLHQQLLKNSMIFWKLVECHKQLIVI